MIPTFIINLENRPDRLQNVLNEFSKTSSFDVTVIKAIKHHFGAIGLWQTMRSIIKTALSNDLEFVLICEDDHQFTPDFNDIQFFTDLKNLPDSVDLILGGLSGIKDFFPVSNRIIWINGFTGMQFTVFFKPFYQTFLDMNLEDGDDIDIIISKFSTNAYCFYPFISTQRDYGYSDVTIKNNREGVVAAYFEKTSGKIEKFLKIYDYFREVI